MIPIVEDESIRICQWWVNEDLASLTPSVKDEKFREYENTFVRKFLKRDITFKQLDLIIRRINREYKALNK